MSSDPTQHQDDFQQLQSKELSRQRSRPPIEIEGYEPRQFLGAGAYGEVWVAIDENTGRKVAIKFYTQKSGVDWSQLSREVEKLVFLSADRYVVQLMDVGWDSDPPYYVMEFVAGGSLQQLLDREGQLPVGEAVEMFREITTGLMHAHGKGVLHCDLKPANILLDQDRKPRLADFGQSRLSHEQTPALGTLFFMAPEQADLAAVPDARWDVYALGALLYCILTGQTPYRTERLLSEIDSSPTLAERLATYRHEIGHAPQPSAHRERRAVDRDLADIVDRCLAVNPDDRFPNVQSVLTALRARDAARDRKPLLLLGLLGPLLFLLILSVFGSSAYRTSVQESDNMLRRWAHESSRFAAKAVAENVARRIDQYFRLVEEQAADAALQQAVLDLQSETSDLLTQLVDDSIHDKASLVAEFVAHPARRELDLLMEKLIVDRSNSVASWFVTDQNGVQLASAILNESVEDSTVGQDYSRRAYFHGGNEDRSTGRHYTLDPLTTTRLSPVFRSEASHTWKIAISTPIVVDAADASEEKQIIGVVALTVELGQLGNDKVLAASKDRFVALVDGRKEHRGQILQHPLFNEVLQKMAKQAPHEPPILPDYGQYKVPLDDLPSAREKVTRVELYPDPLANAEGGAAYARNWIAAQQPVQLNSVSERDAQHHGTVSDLDTKDGDTGLIVLVQEDYDTASASVRNLGDGLLRDAFLAFFVLLGGTVFLWYLVSRAWRDPNEAARRSGGLTAPSSSLQSMETIEIPDQLRARQPPSN